MPAPRIIGRHRGTGRELGNPRTRFRKSSVSWENRKGRHFVCLCVMDARNTSADELGSFCSNLLRTGCAYFCAWGPDCERVHNAMDAEIVGDDPPTTYIGCVMTTWHANEALRDAFGFFLDCTAPDEDFAPDGCASALIIVVDQLIGLRILSVS